MKVGRDRKKLREQGNRLVWTREALDFGQAELARILEISPQRMNNYEMGFRLLDIDLAEQLVKKWKITLDWLYLGDDSSLPKKLAQRIAERREAFEKREVKRDSE